MARPMRNWHYSKYYHVTIRGNNRQSIFQGGQDVSEYFRILRYVYEKYSFEIYAYCIMNNHTHLLLQSHEVPLGKLMAILNKRYSDYFRKKYDYTGQIYENRYFSKEIIGYMSLLNVSAYIHRNPLETKTPIVQTMEQYLFSSYHYYFHNRQSPYPFLNLTLLPNLIPGEQPDKLQAYIKYCIQYERPGTRTTLKRF